MNRYQKIAGDLTIVLMLAWCAVFWTFAFMGVVGRFIGPRETPCACQTCQYLRGDIALEDLKDDAEFLKGGNGDD